MIEELSVELARAMEKHPTLCASGMHVPLPVPPPLFGDAPLGEGLAERRAKIAAELAEERVQLASSTADVRRALRWMAANIAPAGSNRVTIGSYGLKHAIEKVGKRHEYITTGSVIAAAIISGYRFDARGRLNVGIWTTKDSVAKAHAVRDAFDNRASLARPLPKFQDALG